MMDQSKFLFVLQHQNNRYDLMPFSIARTWLDDKGLDIAFYLMYDAVQLVRKDYVEEHADLKEIIDYLFSKNIPVYVCGFCTRACDLNAEKYYPGIEIANRHIYFSLMMSRSVVNY